MTTTATTLTEIRWHGRAGQGIVTASKLLAESALSEGKYFQAFPEYGPERMGAPIQAFTRIDERPIRVHGNIHTPDIVVVFDETLFEIISVLDGLPKNGIVIISSDLSPADFRKKLDTEDFTIYTVDANRIAKECLGRPIPNVPILAALIKATGIVGFENFLGHLKKTMGKKFTQEVIDGNVKAAERAFEEVAS